MDFVHLCVWAHQVRGPGIHDGLAAAGTTNNLPSPGDPERQWDKGGSRVTLKSPTAATAPTHDCLQNSPPALVPTLFSFALVISPSLISFQFECTRLFCASGPWHVLVTLSRRLPSPLVNFSSSRLQLNCHISGTSPHPSRLDQASLLAILRQHFLMSSMVRSCYSFFF